MEKTSGDKLKMDKQTSNKMAVKKKKDTYTS